MKELDKDGRILCELQGKIFERSAKEYTTSSAVFVRRYMNSDYAARMDREGFADRPTDVQDAFDSLDEQYGASQYGSLVYAQDELFWIGYIYRCWAYAYELSSKAERLLWLHPCPSPGFTHPLRVLFPEVCTYRPARIS